LVDRQPAMRPEQGIDVLLQSALAQPFGLAHVAVHTPLPAAEHVSHTLHRDAQQMPFDVQMPVTHWLSLVHVAPKSRKHAPVALHTCPPEHVPGSRFTRQTAATVGVAAPSKHAPGRLQAASAHAIAVDVGAPRQ
jgi:hypothetical protein